MSKIWKQAQFTLLASCLCDLLQGVSRKKTLWTWSDSSATWLQRQGSAARQERRNTRRLLSVPVKKVAQDATRPTLPNVDCFVPPSCMNTCISDQPTPTSHSCWVMTTTDILVFSDLLVPRACRPFRCGSSGSTSFHMVSCVALQVRRPATGSDSFSTVCARRIVS